jgi:hypothetical protein
MQGADCRRFGGADAGLRINVVWWGHLLSQRAHRRVGAFCWRTWCVRHQPCVSDTAFAGKRAPTVDPRKTGNPRRTQNLSIRGNTCNLRRTQNLSIRGNTGNPRRAQNLSIRGNTCNLRRTQNRLIRATPATFGVRGTCRSRLAGEHGVSGIGRVSAIPHWRASALLQLIRAKPATLGVREICRSGATPATIGVRKIFRSGATPATSGVRKIFRSGATPATVGVRKICRSRLAGERGGSDTKIWLTP